MEKYRDNDTPLTLLEAREVTTQGNLATFPETGTHTLVLKSGYVLESFENDSADILRLTTADNKVCLQIILTPKGPVVELQSASLTLAAQKDIKLTCESLEIETKKELAIKSGGSIKQLAQGPIETEGFSQSIVARRGDVAVKANDDVRIDGERIRLNSPRPYNIPKLKTDVDNTP